MTDDYDWIEARCLRCGRLIFTFADNLAIVARVRCPSCKWRGLIRGPDAPSAADLIADDEWWGDGFLGPDEAREVADTKSP